MARRVNISQLQSQLRQVQQKQQQAVNSYNRAVRSYNTKIQQTVNSYNREAAAQNARVRINQRRLQHELAKLRHQSATTRYTAYTRSVETLQQAFVGVESVASRSSSIISRDFLDLSENEAANSVAALNSLLENEDPENWSEVDQLNSTILTGELSSIDPELEARWNGALFALSPQNPDAARHFCTSAREIIVSILEKEAPDEKVKRFDPQYARTPNGGVSRRAKIHYCLARSGSNLAELAQFVDDDIDSVISLFADFNKGTHGGAGSYSLAQLGIIKTRVESAIQFLHQVLR